MRVRIHRNLWFTEINNVMRIKVIVVFLFAEKCTTSTNVIINSWSTNWFCHKCVNLRWNDKDSTRLTKNIMFSFFILNTFFQQHQLQCRLFSQQLQPKCELDGPQFFIRYLNNAYYCCKPFHILITYANDNFIYKMEWCYQKCKESLKHAIYSFDMLKASILNYCK